MERATAIRDSLIQAGLYRSGQNKGTSASTGVSTEGNDLWRIGTTPFPLNQTEHLFLKKLGTHLLAFYEACNQLYNDSINGQAPSWAADYLNQGKPEAILEYARMKRFKRDLPRIIRPDLIPTDGGMIATELDAVPGGIGQTAALSSMYHAHMQGNEVLIGTQEGLLTGFEQMIKSIADKPEPLLAIVVSEESKDYRPEMHWLAKALTQRGLTSFVIEPKAVQFTEEGLFFIESEGRKRPIDVLYRFFELFDLKNIPKSELILYAAKKNRVVLTPPPKAFLEEKSLFALFHHPQLSGFWGRHLGQETKTVLKSVFPKTWLVDPSKVPPHAIIPDLTVAGIPVSDFRELAKASQKERQFALKPSGFSELAWGSRGVSVGHDLSEEDWRTAIEKALTSFPRTPYILQVFHKGRKVRVEYAEFETGRLIEMEGRVRLSPYYFVEGKEAQLGGVLATLCSLEKKLIHGMVDAVMVPCSAPAESF